MTGYITLTSCYSVLSFPLGNTACLLFLGMMQSFLCFNKNIVKITNSFKKKQQKKERCPIREMFIDSQARYNRHLLKIKPCKEVQVAFQVF